ncbi:bifunctional RNase H/acid phosphatase [Nocardia macrotermitis]|uniref:Phosphoglycerate mutase GpmB n=1 Tax=Nocardia macrotermitis TaxID=2585198 RepID=A0A7K0DEN9_9NOCA|nr:bifunctional RNase H/acid phosphatase [Nocardia macrotermitis]MQY24263.1 phosphoglycerate mutase GpmB [Nocardia macrotermitis]
MTDSVIVEADGGSRGNPGPAGYGAVVWDSGHDRVLAERKESLGVTTNNVAEYQGLIAGLAAAVELGAREVAVRMDSKLVVEQMSGRWKVKHAAMIPLNERARRLVTEFDRVDFTWIPRAQNSHADRLANEAMDDAPLIDEVRAATESGAARQVSDDATQRDAGSGATQQVSDRETQQGAEFGVVQQVSGPGATRQDSATGVERTLPSWIDEAADARVAQQKPEQTAPGWTGARGRPTRLLLLRHGQTELSIERRYSGRGNPPLTALGREQAARAAKYLAAKGDIAAIVTSPLGRAQETAGAVGEALDVPVRVMDRLIETDFGDWEGLTFTEAAQADPELHSQWLGDSTMSPPGGESFATVRERIEAARADLVALYPDSNVVVVSHVTPIKTLLQLALGVGPSLLYRLHLDLASLSIAEFYPDGGSSVRLVNETSYL